MLTPTEESDMKSYKDGLRNGLLMGTPIGFVFGLLVAIIFAAGVP